MHVRGLAIGLIVGFAATAAHAAGPASSRATTTPATTTAVGHPSFAADGLTLTAAAADVWDQGPLSIVQLRGPVRVTLGPAKLAADAAVVWLRPALPDGSRPVDVVLVGHAEVTVGTTTEYHDRYWVPAVVSGPIKLTPPPTGRSDENTPTYQAAAALLREQRPAATRAATVPVAPPSDVVALPPVVGAAAAAPPLEGRALQVDRGDLQSARTADGDLALVGSGGVGVHYRDAKQNLIEFTATNMVLFTDLKRSADATAGGSATDHVTAGYFEGDVQVFLTPAGGNKNELRVRAARIYYEFATDRAVMDDVLLHTVDARKGVPVFMRAAAVRQLSQGEYRAEGVVAQHQRVRHADVRPVGRPRLRPHRGQRRPAAGRAGHLLGRQRDAGRVRPAGAVLPAAGGP